ncbi:deoxyribose-phosphate aldolase [bacterium]|nr:deoxyribose-phosphate aldolase [bacterium]
MPGTIREIARVIDHSLLHPTMTDAKLRQECQFARDNNLVAVSIKPYAVPLACEILAGSETAVGAVVGFPHGNSRIDIKVAEAKAAIEDGAVELDAVLNSGKVLSGDWDYVDKEIRALTEAAHAGGAILKLIFENDFLPEDSQKIRLCELCSAAGTDYVKTSTGYGFKKHSSGMHYYDGATEHDLVLMRKHCPAGVKIKAAGGVRNLDALLHVLELGVSRVGLSASAAILDEARARGWK